VSLNETEKNVKWMKTDISFLHILPRVVFRQYNILLYFFTLLKFNITSIHVQTVIFEEIEYFIKYLLNQGSSKNMYMTCICCMAFRYMCPFKAYFILIVHF